MTKALPVEIHAAAHEALRIYSRSFRRGNILRARNQLRNRTLSKRLINFYLDEIDLEIDRMLSESGSAA